MSRFIGIKMSDDEYETYRNMAKVEGKSFSGFVRDKLREAVRQEMREVNLLDRLIKLINDLPERLQLQLKAVGSGNSNEEVLTQLTRLLVYLIKLFEIYSEYTIVMDAKRREFQARKEELKKALGIDVF
jgi:beta-phosphoglucomutase-like phosphatase (HAD superfamily)